MSALMVIRKVKIQDESLFLAAKLSLVILWRYWFLGVTGFYDSKSIGFLEAFFTGSTIRSGGAST